MRGAFGDTPSSGEPTDHEVLDRKTAYAWVITPPKPGRYLEGEHILFERPVTEKQHTVSWGKPRSGNPNGGPGRGRELADDDVRSIRAERERLKTTYPLLGAKYGVSRDTARAACLGIRGYEVVK